MDQLGKDLSVTPERFSGHLAEFKKQGFHTIGLQDFADALEKKKPLPSKPVIFTFDDGYENAYTVALPILERHGMTGTVFVIGNAVGTPGYLSWGQLEDMVDSGVFEIQSHSLNHPDLASLSPELLRYELLGSKDLLESRLGLPMTFLCYPYGKYSAQVADAAKHAGYRGAVTTKYGTLHTKGALFETSRVRLTQHDTGARLEKRSVSSRTKEWCPGDSLANRFRGVPMPHRLLHDRGACDSRVPAASDKVRTRLRSSPFPRPRMQRAY